MATFNSISVRVIAVVIVIYFGLVIFHPSPTVSDRKKATLVGEFISDEYGRFDNRRIAYEKHIGKFYTSIPGVSSVTIHFYEIVEAEDIDRIESYAKQALDAIDVEKIELIFYEKQNWNEYPNGGGWRGKENTVKKIIVRR